MNNDIIREDLENIYRRNIPWELLKDTTVFITGAYGMLASYVTYMLLYLNEKYNMNIRIVVAVRSKEKFKIRFGKYADRKYIVLYQKSLDDPIEIDGEIDYIIHAASLASPQFYALCPVDVLKPNVIGNYNLLELAVKKQIKGYLLFSTGDVYGKVEKAQSITEDSVGTLDTLDIHSCYGESKRMAETMCYAYFKQYNVPVKILRIWHTYAPTMDIKNDPRVFASFMDNLVRGEDIVMKSDGMGRRSFCYIADAVAAYFIVLFKGTSGQAYNICNTSEFCSIRQLAETIVSLRNDIKLNVITKKREPGDSYVENAAANISSPCDDKLRSLGWKPEYTIKAGFGRVLEYLRGMDENPLIS